MLSGSVLGLIATMLLQKQLLLVSALIFVCITAPLTPNMIVESGGAQLWYFIGISLLWFVVGGVMVALFMSLESELTTREAGTDSFGVIDATKAEQFILQPSGCPIESDHLANENGQQIPAFCPSTGSRVRYISENQF